MADWITFDKTSGTGSATVKVTAAANDTPDIREARYLVRNERTGEEKEFTCRQAAASVVVIPEFDYLVLRYIWQDTDGTDFDTATGFENTGLPDVDGKMVGWSMGWNTGTGTTQEKVGDYLIHGGDNMQSGNEAALIQMGPLLDGGNYDTLPLEIRCSIYGNWYGGKQDGNVTISFTAYKGGTMRKQGFNFINDGGEEVYTGEASTVVNASGHDNWEDIKTLYSKVGTMIYNKESRDCIVRIGE